jgi:methylenetetrahydrofolate dehydrogenase (NADP+)/methenyltetrahydrofolate cyclohydrolase
MAQILHGMPVQTEILSRLTPGLAVVLVGHDPASEIYVRSKIKACAELGIFSEQLSPPESSTTAELLAIIGELNHRSDIDGILVQMPLPKHVDARAVLEAVAPGKDADGFHPVNVGYLVAGRPAPRSCTPAGVIALLKYYDIAIEGRQAVVLGRSDIVGKPMALMLLHENATVTICHSRTVNLPDVCRRADILVAAIGRPAFVTADFIASGATVIDVGINRLPAADGKSRLVGDVAFKEVAEVAGAITPVPGGVGQMTVACLLVNTLRAACAIHKLPAPGV